MRAQCNASQRALELTLARHCARCHARPSTPVIPGESESTVAWVEALYFRGGTAGEGRAVAAGSGISATIAPCWRVLPDSPGPGSSAMHALCRRGPRGLRAEWLASR